MSIRSFKRARARRLFREQRRTATLRRKGGLIAGLALTSSTLMVANAQAATFTVTTTGDDAAGGTCDVNNQCTTLRDALSVATGDSSPDTITFASGVTGTITLGNGALALNGSNPVTITGPGASTLAVSGAGTSQVLVDTDTAASSITGLTLTDGASTNTPGGAVQDTGAALTLTSDTISASSTPDGYSGGGIYTNQPLTLDQTTVTGNTSGASGGGLYAKAGASITAGAVSSNQASGAGGGANFSGGDVTITGTAIANNTAGTNGSGQGGGLDANVVNTLTVSSSTISGNTGTEGVGIYARSSQGETIDHSVISNNRAVPNSTSPNEANRGGGIELDNTTSHGLSNYAPTRIENSTISGNQATFGAGVYVDQVTPYSPTTISRSTLSGNSGGTGSVGGGLMLAGAVSGKFELLDSTISGNSAATGAGVSLGRANGDRLNTDNGKYTGFGTVSFDNSTIAANTASAHGGGIYLAQYKTYASQGAPVVYESGTASLTSTIVGDNSAQGISDDLERGASSTSGGFTGAFSLVESPGDAPLTKNAVITGISPMLGPLAANGGPTQTMLPSGTSPVIDQGHASPSLTTDQIGNPRDVETAIADPAGGDGTDIGAVELPTSSVVLPPLPPAPPSAPTSGITLSVHGASLAVSGRSLLVGNQTPVTCSVKAGTLNSCAIQVTVGAKVIADGEATSQTATTSLTTRLSATKAGLAYLKHRPLGSDAVATLVASQSAPGTDRVTGNVHFLAGPSIAVGLGTRSAKLSQNIVSELDRIAKLLSGTKTVTCTAYSDKGTGDVSLTKTQAQNACARLKKDGLSGKYRVVGRGHAKPVSKTRAANRRLVVSFTF